jgi:tungstate transport system substrate-binding protein
MVLSVFVCAGALVAAGCFGAPPENTPERLVLQSTTSVRDSGLLDAILPVFESQYNAEVSVVAVGTGQAIENAKRGDGDILLVHSPSQEQALVANGSATTRWTIMYNFFAIVGPDEDPAGVRSAPTAADAFQRIWDNESVFVSRGDGSGTHTKEKSIWTSIGQDTADFSASWYKSVGRGMGDTLQTAFQLEGYTLTDEGTYWSLPDIGTGAPEGGLHIVLGGLAHPADDLKNIYSVLQLNHTRLPDIHWQLAEKFALWITSPETAALIGNYTFAGHQLFFPDAHRT